ncbi:MAG TPA: CPBP family intramembrane glutamic endopeptidase [Kofleriaceae bacterium]|nr:CPBP family intramembrane glutamic endopeptidase [Kofleriaceae bacterium]
MPDAPAREPGPYGHGDVAASLALVFPLLLAYEVGVLFAGRVNGADVVTRALFAATGGRTGYLLVHAVIALGFLVWVGRARPGTARGRGCDTGRAPVRDALRLEVVVPVVLEAAIYALALGGLITLVVHRGLGLGAGGDVIGAPPCHPSERAGLWVGALGAGVHEELVFRLALVAGIARLLRGQRGALAVALVGSSLAFAAAHHLGPGGEPYTAHAFACRTVAGLLFGAIFWFRSLAHAVYAHVLYDLLVAWT